MTRPEVWKIRESFQTRLEHKAAFLQNVDRRLMIRMTKSVQSPNSQVAGHINDRR